MTEITTAQIYLYGAIALSVLLGGYILFEIGVALLGAVRRGRLKEPKVSWLFALPATLIAFLPSLCVSLINQLPLTPPAFSESDFGLLFTLFFTLGLGFVGELGAIWWFSRQLRALEKPAALAPNLEQHAPSHEQQEQGKATPQP